MSSILIETVHSGTDRTGERTDHAAALLASLIHQGSEVTTYASRTDLNRGPNKIVVVTDQSAHATALFLVAGVSTETRDVTPVQILRIALSRAESDAANPL